MCHSDDSYIKALGRDLDEWPGKKFTSLGVKREEEDFLKKGRGMMHFPCLWRVIELIL